MMFEVKYFPFYIQLTEQILLPGCIYFIYETLGNMCFVIVYQPGEDIINFEINLIFHMKPFFPYDQKPNPFNYQDPQDTKTHVFYLARLLHPPK